MPPSWLPTTGKSAVSAEYVSLTHPRHPTIPRANKCACVTDIYVREAFRKGDIAGRITHLLTEEARKLGYGKIYIDPVKV